MTASQSRTDQTHLCAISPSVTLPRRRTEQLGGYFTFRNLAVIAVGDRGLDSLLCLPGGEAGLVREASGAGSVWSARGIFAERPADSDDGDGIVRASCRK